jgi:hypothetical protein
MTQQEEGAIDLPKASCWQTRKPLKTIAETYFTSKCGNLLDGCEVDLHPCGKQSVFRLIVSGKRFYPTFSNLVVTAVA